MSNSSSESRENLDQFLLQNLKIRDRQELVEAARKYIGVPFRHRGRDKTGIDCGGLVIASLRDCGYDPPDMKVYGREPHKDGLRDFLTQGIGPGAKRQARWPAVGDVVLIAFDGKNPQHVALVGNHPLGNGKQTLIHSYGGVGKVVEHGYDNAWLSKTVAVFRFDLDHNALKR